MRDSDWSREILLRSDWSGPRVAPYTTFDLKRLSRRLRFTNDQIVEGEAIYNP